MPWAGFELQALGVASSDGDHSPTNDVFNECTFTNEVNRIMLLKTNK